jgi:hypothetical protein
VHSCNLPSAEDGLCVLFTIFFLFSLSLIEGEKSSISFSFSFFFVINRVLVKNMN